MASSTTTTSSFDSLPSECDVLICGAGATGLTLAIELARRNVNFLLIDKIAAPFGGSRGKGIQPRTLEVLEEMGVLEGLCAAGTPYPIQRMYGPDGVAFQDTPLLPTAPVTVAEPHPNPLLVMQAHTEAALRARLAELGGGAPRYGIELTALEQDDRRVTAHVTSSLNGGAGEQPSKVISARFLVGGDGGHSKVRHLLNVGFPGNTMGVRAIVADVEVDGLPFAAWHKWHERTMNQVGLCSLDPREPRLYQLQGPVALEGDIDTSAAALNAMLKERLGRTDIVITHVRWASIYSMNARLADNYRMGRILLAGDAAHIHPPTGGQGLNTSLQDAYNLAWKLAARVNGAPDALLDSYEAERRPVAAGVLGLATGLLEAIKQGREEKRDPRATSQLDVGYPLSPLNLSSTAVHTAEEAPIHGGARAPDARLFGHSGQPHRLFSLLQGTHWTLLGYGISSRSTHLAALGLPRASLRVHLVGATSKTPVSDAAYFDEDGTLRAAFHLRGAQWVLIRPDGYVAGVLDESESPALVAYLATVGL